MMKKEKELKRMVYTTPLMEIVSLETSCHILEASYPGQHKNAERGGEVQEDPAGQNDAKKAFLFDE